jgi:hypothetical protein
MSIDFGPGYVQLQETLEKTRGELQRKNEQFEITARHATALADELQRKQETAVALALGWAWSEACAQLDAGDDPRKYNMAKLLPDALKALDEVLKE